MVPLVVKIQCFCGFLMWQGVALVQHSCLGMAARPWEIVPLFNRGIYLADLGNAPDWNAMTSPSAQTSRIFHCGAWSSVLQQRLRLNERPIVKWLIQFTISSHVWQKYLSVAIAIFFPFDLIQACRHSMVGILEDHKI